MKPGRQLDYIDGLFKDMRDFSNSATKDKTDTQMIQ